VGNREVVLLAPFHRGGTHRVAVIVANGNIRLRAVRLPESHFSNEGFSALGFAVDPIKDRAFIFPGGGPIAIVDLGSLSVRYRGWPHLRRRVFAPAVERPSENHYGGAVGSLRWAEWLGGGVIAVAGEEDRPSRSGSGGTVSTPYGLELIDTRDWTAKLVDARANRVSASDGIAFASLSDSFGERSPSAGLGLTAYARTGGLLFHRYGHHAVVTFAIGKKVYVKHGGHVDIRVLPSGKLVRRIPFGGERRHQLFPVLGWRRGYVSAERGFN
jgi:hypothetical protein